jgi:hypothetical protein
LKNCKIVVQVRWSNTAWWSAILSVCKINVIEPHRKGGGALAAGSTHPCTQTRQLLLPATNDTMGCTLDFTSMTTVSELAGTCERMVCLQFPEGLGSLYCHSFLLSFSSTVLRHVLEDTQKQDDQLCTIPLAGDSDLSVWQLALGRIYRLDSATITLDNAQALLLLAHKYDMRSVTGKPPPPRHPTPPLHSLNMGCACQG